MWLEDSITKLERAAHAAWPGVLEEAQLPMVGWSYVLLSKREEKDRARIFWKKRLAPFNVANAFL